jgi:chorismate-pyruvate lyase
MVTSVARETSAETALQLSELSIFQQILLITDGTLTNILETYVGERLQVVKLSEELRPGQHEAWLLLSPGSSVIERKILLQGKESHNNWLYAESLIVPARVDAIFQDRLITSQEPIGKLWLEHKVETFKELLTTYQQPAGALARHFTITPHDTLLCRTYRVLSNRQPTMLITEKFPASYYTVAPGGGIR